MGSDVLGTFFCDNAGKPKSVIVANAENHFRQFVNLVRPIVSAPSAIQGTISDGHLFLCTGSAHPWALIVLIRTGDQLHGVLIPTLEDADGAARFVRFLDEPPPRFEVKFAAFKEDHWEVSKTPSDLNWPPATYSTPASGA
jgi:hypothetical protein